MKRALPLVLTLIVAGAAAAGIYALARRHRVDAPVQGPSEAALFKAAPAGAGFLFSLNGDATQPLRSLRYVLVQGSNEALAQALTQTGDQLIGRFQDGSFAGTLRLPAPENAPSAFFRFARLQDAARMADGSLLLLYTDGAGGSAAPWLVAVDGATGQSRWALKASGGHLAMEPGGASCLLWDGTSMARATWKGAPDLTPLPLPDGVSVVDALLPLKGSVLLVHPGGLARYAGGAWSTTPLPDPGPLSFPGMAGAVTATGYWQPRPGQLARIEADGSVSAVDLSKWTMPKGHEQDAALLRLAGADAKGRLWFTLASPDLTVASEPPAAPEPSAALQAMAALNGSAAPPPPEPPKLDPAAWITYLKGGLDRVYIWDPATAAPRLLDWKARWPSCGAPADFPMPLPRHLHPESGALMQELGTRAWWMPLDKL